MCATVLCVGMCTIWLLLPLLKRIPTRERSMWLCSNKTFCEFSSKVSIRKQEEDRKKMQRHAAAKVDEFYFLKSREMVGGEIVRFEKRKWINDGIVREKEKREKQVGSKRWWDIKADIGRGDILIIVFFLSSHSLSLSRETYLQKPNLSSLQFNSLLHEHMHTIVLSRNQVFLIFHKSCVLERDSRRITWWNLCTNFSNCHCNI